MTRTLILLRHGESDWNAKNLFTGWVDVDLTDKGEAEAAPRRRAAARRAACCPTSCTPRCCAGRSAPPNIALDAADRHWIPVRRTWRLNERHYGALQGKDKKQTLEEFGEEQFMLWRRSYDTPPPPIDRRRRVLAGRRPALRRAARRAVPRTECLKDVVDADAAVLVRRDRARPARRATVLVAAHGNSLRALVKHLDGISRRGHRRAQHPDRHPAASTSSTTTCSPTAPGGEYLDPEAAAGRRSRRSRTRAADAATGSVQARAVRPSRPSRARAWPVTR